MSAKRPFQQLIYARQGSLGGANHGWDPLLARRGLRDPQESVSEFIITNDALKASGNHSGTRVGTAHCHVLLGDVPGGLSPNARIFGDRPSEWRGIMNADQPRRCAIVADPPVGAQIRVRTRDPERRGRILASAADLVARKGFHAASIAEIGAAAGITGSGVYRHFDSKSAVLVSLFDQIIDDLLRDEREVLDSTSNLSTALDLLIAGQVEFVVGDRELAQVYYKEIDNLPQEDRRRLRRKQRLYLEEWVHLVSELRADLSDADARVVVHETIGAIQSPLFYDSGLAEDRLRVLLTDAARAIVGVARPRRSPSRAT